MSEPTKLDSSRNLEADLALCDAATPGPWFTVDAVWLPPGCGTYVIAGHPDPHVGKPVLDHIDIDEWPAEEDAPDYSQSDADLEFAAAARTGWPAALRRALAAEARIKELEQAVRTHRDQRGDDRCWMDDEALYGVLPEGYTPPARDSFVELERCREYIACRHHPGTVYVSPQRRIEELEAELVRVRAERDRLRATRAERGEDD